MRWTKMTTVHITLVGDKDMNDRLNAKGLAFDVLHMQNENDRESGCDKVSDVMFSAFGRTPEPWFFKYYDRLVVLSEKNTGKVVASAAVHLDTDEEESQVQFKIRFESVDKKYQRTGVGSLLFTVVERFAIRHIVELGYIGGMLVAFVDKDKLEEDNHPEHWHGEFMLKNGFTRLPAEDEIDEEDPGLAFGKILEMDVQVLENILAEPALFFEVSQKDIDAIKKEARRVCGLPEDMNLRAISTEDNGILLWDEKKGTNPSHDFDCGIGNIDGKLVFVKIGPSTLPFTIKNIVYTDKWGPFTLSRYKPCQSQNHPVATWEERGICLVWYEDLRVVSLRHKPDDTQTLEWADGWDMLGEWVI